MAVMWTSECPVTAASNCIAIRTEARTGQGRPQAARRGRPSYQPLFSPTTRPLPSHVGERGRLSWATAGTERTQNRQASTHTPPRLRTRPTRDLGRAVSGHEAALVHLASPLDVGREGTRAHRGQENRGQPAGGGPAPQAPGPASPAGRTAEATRTQLGRDASGLGTQAPTFAHVALKRVGGSGRSEGLRAVWRARRLGDGWASPVLGRERCFPGLDGIQKRRSEYLREPSCLKWG